MPIFEYACCHFCYSPFSSDSGFPMTQGHIPLAEFNGSLSREFTRLFVVD